MQYPLRLSFKTIALSPQFFVRDQTGSIILYVKQKLVSSEWETKVYSDTRRTEVLYTMAMNAEKVINVSNHFKLLDQSGNLLGSVKRLGVLERQPSYDIFRGDEEVPALRVAAENPGVSRAEGCLMAIPLLGWFLSGFIFHSAYLATSSDGAPMMRLQKEAAFFHGRYRIDKLAEMDGSEEMRILLSLMVVSIWDRGRYSGF